MRGLNIYITGNVASGKSTLSRLASEHLSNGCLVSEPHEANPFLPLYLQDQQRWGFTSTVHYYWDYVRRYAEATANTRCTYYFVDAGTWTNRLVYTEYLYRERFISQDEYTFYQTLCGLIEKAYNHPPADGFIFVNTSPQTCWERMHRRGWTYQTSTIQLPYLETLHRYFEGMKRAVAAQNLPILELDSEQINFTRPEGQQEALGRIERFLQGYQPPDS